MTMLWVTTLPMDALLIPPKHCLDEVLTVIKKEGWGLPHRALSRSEQGQFETAFEKQSCSLTK